MLEWGNFEIVIAKIVRFIVISTCVTDTLMKIDVPTCSA